MNRSFLAAIAALSTAFCTDFAIAKDEIEIRQSTEQAASPSAKITDIAFLAGQWLGEGLGGRAEDFIDAPEGDRMIGMFSQMNPDGSPRFFEFYFFVEENGTLIVKLKHFNPDMTGWEERAEMVLFPLVAIEGTTAYFNGLTFSLRGKDKLDVAVQVGDTVEVFRYARVRRPLR